MKKMKWLSLAVPLTLSAGVLAGCGEDEAAAGAGDAGETEALSGEVLLDGSSTVQPIMEAITYMYNQTQPEVETVLNTSGTGGGFERFTLGETDFSNASRPIAEDEIALAEENGIEYTELEVAYDGLSVVVSQQNDFVDELTVEQLREIFLADSGATMWSDINPDWPEEEIVIFSPGHDSGTFDYFNEVILEEQPMREDENVTLSENDNTLVTGIQGNPYAIGFFGYAYYEANQDTLKVLGISEEGGEAVLPSPETIQDGTYTPLSRPLFTYVNNEALATEPQVADFSVFILENAAEAAEQVGYVALPEEMYQEQLDTITNIIGAEAE
ncbi:PstS family phosphate ABC transporter substrate-binding protein [Planococcus lenghuensis]|uniref:Phosphate-binding protein n=1 Tax=Planococcus lenghuensis TaxID=2213202 RepID=A0A1Q2L2M0_9BACL|nr:PstS family phosphate ABC transporter substrate-binding protein [Planococcus lenghuensis]AQQ54680.1 phosphate-binding protein [Planococcus lenghuensis]